MKTESICRCPSLLDEEFDNRAPRSVLQDNDSRLARPDAEAEAGFANQESVFMQGILFPAGTPKVIIDQWYGDISRIAATRET